MERGRCKWYWEEYGECRLGWRPGRTARPAGRFRQAGWAEPINGWRYYFFKQVQEPSAAALHRVRRRHLVEAERSGLARSSFPAN